MKIKLNKNPKVKPDSTSLGFGKFFTDHMLVMDYENGNWKEPEIIPYGPFALEPSTCVLHYGQGIFEGLKAYKNEKNEITLFRPRDNFNRMNKGALRMCMPTLDVDLVLKSLNELLLLEKDWIPSNPGTSLYIRPTLIAKDAMLGVLHYSLTCWSILCCWA
jgi:branched-chain amino acid aminotransferase